MMKSWPFDVGPNEQVTMSDGTIYLVTYGGWRRIKSSARRTKADAQKARRK